MRTMLVAFCIAALGALAATVFPVQPLRTCKVCEESCCPKTNNCSCLHVDTCTCITGIAHE